MKNRTVLITGGGRGIGNGIVEACAGQSWNVAFCGRTPAEQYRDRCEQLRKQYGVQAKYYSCDISELNDSKSLLDSVVNDFGQLDALVNNAGVAPLVRADLLDMSVESFDRVMGINLRGPFFLAQAVARYMVGEKTRNDDYQGTMVLIGSVSATVASISRGEYCLSKAGVAMMTKLFAVRLAQYGIPVYELRPGIIHSDMTSTVTEKYDKMIAAGLTLQPRWGEPADVGRAVAMLLRGDLAYSTGQVIGIDGGMEIGRL
ncbi:MAG: 3-ketoacyl-ACP reductase [Thermoguttaceae bacterium]|nr:3-ketoacyl-ACP reductase [Thermoguttaceae bacterium]